MKKRVAPTVGRKKLSELSREPRAIVGALALEVSTRGNRNMNPILSRAILLLITIFSGCSKGITKPSTKPNAVQVKTISPKVFFPDSTEQKKEYLAKMRTLKKGDKIEEV